MRSGGQSKTSIVNLVSDTDKLLSALQHVLRIIPCVFLLSPRCCSRAGVWEGAVRELILSSWAGLGSPVKPPILCGITQNLEASSAALLSARACYSLRGRRSSADVLKKKN